MLLGMAKTKTGKTGRNPDGTFAKGNTANLSGRPKKGETLTDLLRLMGEEVDKKTKTSRRDRVIKKMWEQAETGMEATQRYIFDRIDGKPVQEIKTGGGLAIDAPVTITFGVAIEYRDPDETDSGE